MRCFIPFEPFLQSRFRSQLHGCVFTQLSVRLELVNFAWLIRVPRRLFGCRRNCVLGLVTTILVFFSFCAEEEFYLLLLPFLIWNVDHILGRRVTLIVCIGLVLGNTMKDVFGLPRPPSPPVWRPAHQEAIDSTNLQDFGFPSTHAMNAVSNSAFTFLYLTSTPSTFNVQDILSDRKNALMFAFVILYISSLCLSRLYLGAHTPTDLRGGLSLGVILTATYWASSEVIDSYYLSTPNLLLKLIFTGMITLLLMPQPRPVTPTFSQNALLCGLITGCCYGSRQYVDLKSISFHGNAIITGDGMTFSLPEYVPVDLVRSIFLAWNPYLRTFIRTIFGYIVVLLLRVVAKSVSTMILSCVGISVKPHIDRQMSRQRRRKKLRVVRLFTRDIDIVGSAIVKMFTYSVLAWAITFFVPFLDCVLGLLEYEQNQLI
uniref:Phosphatidic acid phosphatase type 2/haloperoxidase domain-containing protein n=1 Tax=Mucochytrium quahogii TaxID=96639 RepID=A0A7S2RAL0_9STRA|mmetsp:Transcript_18121/g.30865  ORF Transcript_18121/g.30865 Transcript_18121/m.30865 type:complete len:430 (+) Transcript_18121:252-1541(+)